MKLGFVGLGGMGMPMVRRLVAAGRDLIVWNRTAEKAHLLVDEGCAVATSLATLMEEADTVALCVTSHVAVESIAFGPNGLFNTPTPRAAVIVDFSTGAVEAAKDFAARAGARSVSWVDAPVSGGIPGATRGELTVFAGGDRSLIDSLDLLFAPIAARVTRMGEVGSGQAAKICNQAIVAANLLVIAETLAFAKRAGIAVERLPEAMKGGFADSLPLQIFGPRMVAHQCKPHLGSISLMAKDAELARSMASRVSAYTPMLQCAVGVFASVRNHPELSEDSDLSSLMTMFEENLR